MRLEVGNTNKLNKLPISKSEEDLVGMSDDFNVLTPAVTGLMLKMVLIREKLGDKQKFAAYASYSDLYSALFQSSKDLSKIEIPQISMAEFYKTDPIGRYC